MGVAQRKLGGPMTHRFHSHDRGEYYPRTVPALRRFRRVRSLPTLSTELPAGSRRRVRRATEQRSLPALCSGGITGLNVLRRSPCPTCIFRLPSFLSFPIPTPSSVPFLLSRFSPIFTILQ
uniref:Uncharacterized protein n=1 Tax=Physcomitrium patens TaxID=3218 RepID=A0A2K1IXH0_PHYPA|nr:hypothetical protein PHYPA_023788 [Physcomitrium patens]